MFFRMVYKSGQIFRFVTIHACDRRTEFSSQRVTITCLIHIILMMFSRSWIQGSQLRTDELMKFCGYIGEIPRLTFQHVKSFWLLHQSSVLLLE